MEYFDDLIQLYNAFDWIFTDKKGIERGLAILSLMRFEVVFKKDKLKGMESIFKMTAALLKAKHQNFQVLFLYLPD